MDADPGPPELLLSELPPLCLDAVIGSFRLGRDLVMLSLASRQWRQLVEAHPAWTALTSQYPVRCLEDGSVSEPPGGRFSAVVRAGDGSWAALEAALSSIPEGGSVLLEEGEHGIPHGRSLSLDRSVSLFGRGRAQLVELGVACNFPPMPIVSRGLQVALVGIAIRGNPASNGFAVSNYDGSLLLQDVAISLSRIGVMTNFANTHFIRCSLTGATLASSRAAGACFYSNAGGSFSNSTIGDYDVGILVDEEPNVLKFAGRTSVRNCRVALRIGRWTSAGWELPRIFGSGEAVRLGGAAAEGGLELHDGNEATIVDQRGMPPEIDDDQ